VLLPAVTGPLAPAGSHPPQPKLAAGAGRRLLVVDDEEAIRVVTARTLERHGFTVETAADVVPALGAPCGRAAALGGTRKRWRATKRGRVVAAVAHLGAR